MKFSVLLFFVFVSLTQAQSLTIAAASDLGFAIKELVADFKKKQPDAEISLILGSSGKFYHQILNGAPYDLYFSADIAYPEKLLDSGHAVGEVSLYATGRIVLWSRQIDVKTLRAQALLHESVKKIAIANPEHAPYGARAKEFLQSNAMWQKVEPNLVYGENISQAANYALMGGADIGIIALSLAVAPTMADKGSFWLIPSEMHQPLEQGYVLLKRAENNPLQKAFRNYLKSDEALKIFSKYGFSASK